MLRTSFEDRLGIWLGTAIAGDRMPIPDGGEFAWQWFIDLNDTRTVGPHGPNPISFTEIEAYLRLMRWPASPHHVDMIRALDRAWMAHVRKQMASGKDGERAMPSGKLQPITAEIMDAFL